MKIVSPSLLAANFMALEEDIELINRSNAQWLHLDVMDGTYVPNISFGSLILKAVAKSCTKRLDVHFMVDNPYKYIEEASKLNVMMMSVHYECCPNLQYIIDEIHAAGMKAGIMINPSTTVGVLKDVISEADMFGVMAVNPGFGGQRFIDNTYSKVLELKNLIEKCHSKALIEVDGGIDDVIGQQLAQAGADVLVAGSYIFNSSCPEERISQLYKL